MDKKAAVEKLFRDVYLPAFLKKAASRGIRPDSQESLDELLKIAVKIRTAGIKPEVSKQAEFLKQASAGLDTVLGNLAKQASTPRVDPSVAEALKALKA